MRSPSLGSLLGILTIALATAAPALAEKPPERPEDLSAVAQYRESIPTSTGSQLPGTVKRKVTPLPPKVASKVRKRGGKQAKKLVEIATSADLGAPQTVLPKPAAEPRNEPKPVVESKPVARPEPRVEPRPAVEPKPAVEPRPAVEPKPPVRRARPTQRQRVADREPVARPPEIRPAAERTRAEQEPVSAGRAVTAATEYVFAGAGLDRIVAVLVLALATVVAVVVAARQRRRDAF
jgi:hypothetical protein